jgi:hypothetical protein
VARACERRGWFAFRFAAVVGFTVKLANPGASVAAMVEANSSDTDTVAERYRARQAFGVAGSKRLGRARRAAYLVVCGSQARATWPQAWRGGAAKSGSAFARAETEAL